MRFHHFEKRYWLYLTKDHSIGFEHGLVRGSRWVEFSWGMDQPSDGGVQFSAGLGYGFWLTWHTPWNFMKKARFPRFERKFGLRWDFGSLHLTLFSDEWGEAIGMSKNRHRWKLWDNKWVTGRDRYTTLVIWEGDGTVEVGQWDGDTYEVDARLERQRWTNRFRTKERYSFWMDAKRGASVPVVPGKGENSWDCGDDAIMGCGYESGTFADALEHYAEAVRSTRLRYGGKNWRPLERTA